MFHRKDLQSQIYIYDKDRYITVQKCLYETYTSNPLLFVVILILKTEEGKNNQNLFWVTVKMIFQILHTPYLIS